MYDIYVNYTFLMPISGKKWQKKIKLFNGIKSKEVVPEYIEFDKIYKLTNWSRVVKLQSWEQEIKWIKQHICIMYGLISNNCGDC